MDLVGALVAESGVSAATAVELLDVGDDVALCALFRRVNGAVDPLVFSPEMNDSAIALSQHYPANVDRGECLKLMVVVDSWAFRLRGRFHVTTRTRASSETQTRRAAARRRSQRE